MRWKEFRDNNLKYYVITQLEEEMKFPKHMIQFVPFVNPVQNTTYPYKCEVKQH
jgi:hypothetical protein